MDLSDTSRARVLVVDDTPANLELISELLKGHYDIRVAINGERGLALARKKPAPDLILLDIMMPDISGYDVCTQLKADPLTADIPVIFLTAMHATEDETHGLELGAADFITKPVNPPILLKRVEKELKVKAAADLMRDKNAFLEAEVSRRTEQLMAVQNVTIEVMSSLAETRDQETGFHIRRVQHYVKTLAELLLSHPDYAGQLDETTIDWYFKSAPLHDIGKIGIPDAILMKPGTFTPEEFAIMKTHTTIGRDVINMAEERLGIEVPFLRYAKEFALYHHERWDGSGYPEGLHGTDIPLGARILAISDVYDALINRRVYKQAYPHDQALETIRKGRGSHFDPVMLDTFLANANLFRDIADRYRD